MDIKALINHSLRWLQTLGVPVIRPRIRRTLQHDPQAFTQGLAFVDGYLYESTGGSHQSTLRRLSLDTGETLEVTEIEKYFAEDIAYVNDKLHQLTWQGGRVFQYDLMPIRLAAEGRIATEGWGLAPYHHQLVMSDGTHRLRVLDKRFQIAREIPIRRWLMPFRHLNAMEVVGETAFVNLWYSDLIAKIDLARGQLVGIIDCSEIRLVEAPRDNHDILNGIAYIPTTNSFIVTGKHWRQMYDIVTSKAQ